MIYTFVFNVPDKGRVEIPVLFDSKKDLVEQIEEYVFQMRSLNPDITCEGYFESPISKKINK